VSQQYLEEACPGVNKVIDYMCGNGFGIVEGIKD
jgi:hypothetical protein